ncbi:MAG: hypothetical protein R6U50_00765, partial [Desulfobacterales bacterium]
LTGLFIVLSDDGEVSEAQADVSNLHPQAVLQHGNFSRVMEEAGLEPQPHDYNGNLVYFAHGESRMRPDELADYFQRKFVQAGINSRMYDSAYLTDLDPDEMEPGEYSSPEEMLGNTIMPEQIEQGRARLNGEVVPMHMSPGSMQMSGIIPHQQAADGVELARQLEQQSTVEGVDLDQRINGWRFHHRRLWLRHPPWKRPM